MRSRLMLVPCLALFLAAGCGGLEEELPSEMGRAAASQYGWDCNIFWTHAVQPGETIRSIAARYYGDASLTWAIARCNPGCSTSCSICRPDLCQESDFIPTTYPPGGSTPPWMGKSIKVPKPLQPVCSTSTCYRTRTYASGSYRWRATCTPGSFTSPPDKLWGTAGPGGPCYQCTSAGWVSSSGCPAESTPTPPLPPAPASPPPICAASACSSCTCYKNYVPAQMKWVANCSGSPTAVAGTNILLRGHDGKCYQCQTGRGWVWVTNSACSGS